MRRRFDSCREVTRLRANPSMLLELAESQADTPPVPTGFSIDLLAIVRVAARALLSNKMLSTLTILGIIIGVGAVICTVAIGQGAANQAQESLRILRNRYDAGLVTIMDVLKAETMRTSAQNNHLNALYDYRLADSALELATGELSPTSPAVTQ